MPGCVFQAKWLTDPELNCLVKRDSNIHAAFCRFCNKSIDLTTMGRTALVSHMKGRKHTDRLKQAFSHSQGPIETYVTSTPSATASNESLSQPVQFSNSKHLGNTMESFVSNAEILWCLKTIDSNYSFSSNTGITDLFKCMFPDSNIARTMSCAETKSMYMTCFGLAPYFSLLLEKKLKNQPFVLMFDESLNREIQKKQTLFLGIGIMIQ